MEVSSSPCPRNLAVVVEVILDVAEAEADGPADLVVGQKTARHPCVDGSRGQPQELCHFGFRQVFTSQRGWFVTVVRRCVYFHASLVTAPTSSVHGSVIGLLNTRPILSLGFGDLRPLGIVEHTTPVQLKVQQLHWPPRKTSVYATFVRLWIFDIQFSPLHLNEHLEDSNQTFIVPIQVERKSLVRGPSQLRDSLQIASLVITQAGLVYRPTLEQLLPLPVTQLDVRKFPRVVLVCPPPHLMQKGAALMLLMRPFHRKQARELFPLFFKPIRIGP